MPPPLLLRHRYRCCCYWCQITLSSPLIADIDIAAISWLPPLRCCHALFAARQLFFRWCRYAAIATLPPRCHLLPLPPLLIDDMMLPLPLITLTLLCRLHAIDTLIFHAALISHCHVTRWYATTPDAEIRCHYAYGQLTLMIHCHTLPVAITCWYAAADAIRWCLRHWYADTPITLDTPLTDMPPYASASARCRRYSYWYWYCQILLIIVIDYYWPSDIFAVSLWHVRCCHWYVIFATRLPLKSCFDPLLLHTLLILLPLISMGVIDYAAMPPPLRFAATLIHWCHAADYATDTTLATSFHYARYCHD